MVKWRDEVCNYYSYVQDYLTVQARQECPTKSTLQGDLPCTYDNSVDKIILYFNRSDETVHRSVHD